MDAVLEVIGIRTKKHAELGSVDSLRQWSAVQRSNVMDTASQATLVTPLSPMTDSALGDEVDEAVEAIDYVETSDDIVPSWNRCLLYLHCWYCFYYHVLSPLLQSSQKQTISTVIAVRIEVKL